MAKPAAGATLNSGNSLTTGLSFFLPLLTLGTPTDIINSVAGTLSGNAAMVTSASYGPAISFDGTDDYVGFTGILSALSGKATTLFLLAKVTGVDTFGAILWGTNTTNSCFWQFTNGTTGTVIQAGSTFTAAGVTWADSTYHLFVFTNDGSTVTMYVDGAQVGTDSNATVALASGAKDFHLGNWIGGTSWDMTGEIAYMGFYGARTLSGAEVTTLNANPFALLSAASGGGSTGGALSASTGLLFGI